jgi:hypothetical protein
MVGEQRVGAIGFDMVLDVLHFCVDALSGRAHQHLARRLDDRGNG